MISHSAGHVELQCSGGRDEIHLRLVRKGREEKKIRVHEPPPPPQAKKSRNKKFCVFPKETISNFVSFYNPVLRLQIYSFHKISDVFELNTTNNKY